MPLNLGIIFDKKYICIKMAPLIVTSLKLKYQYMDSNLINSQYQNNMDTFHNHKPAPPQLQ